MKYIAPWWLPGGDMQTIWAALRSRRFLGPKPVFRRERWATPDGDFIDVDWLMPMEEGAATGMPTGEGSRRKIPAPGVQPASPPLLVVFHGLEGSSASHYAEAFADVARSRGWSCAVPHFRGCSGELNLAPRAYHSGDFAEIDWILKRFAAQHAGPVVAAGISLGGNALMRWAGEVRGAARECVAGIASICSPLDLAASGWAIGKGFNRQVYTRMFLRTMVPKALQKFEQHPGLFDREKLLAARDLYAFDNVFTAPVHGFENADDYWARASAKPHLRHIAVPSLVLNALNDPFIPAASLPTTADISSDVTLWQPAQGGHVGFPSPPFPGHVRFMPEVVAAFLGDTLKPACF